MTAKGRVSDSRQEQAAFLFAALRLEAPAISRATRVPLEDVEQQMMLMCLEYAHEFTDYNPRRGPQRRWLIKRAWLWARRWSKASARGEDTDSDCGFEMATDNTCAGTDDLLIDEETQRAKEHFLARLRQNGGRVADPRTGFEFLSVEHWSERVAVNWCAGSRKMARHAKRYAAALETVAGPTRSAVPVRESRAADTSAANI